MPRFKYKGIDEKGNQIVGMMNSADIQELRAILDKRNIYLVDAKEKKSLFKSSFFAVSSKVKLDEVTSFCRQLSVMISAGVSIVDSIALLKEQGTPKFKEVLGEIYGLLLIGKSLNEAFGNYPKVFPRFFTDMIYIGEESGTLERTLKVLADYYENSEKMKKKAKNAMIYPIILLSITFVVLLVMIIGVIPMFKNMFTEYGIEELPKMSRIVFSISDFFLDYWTFVLTGLVIFALILVMFLRTKPGRYLKDFLKLHFPIVKKVTKNMITARFARGFGILCSSGMKIIDSLDIMAKALGNVFVEDKFLKAIDEIKKGKGISESLKKTNIFPAMLIEMINVGEQTGSLDEVLETSANYYDTCVDSSIQKATTAIEPVMLLLMGAMVAVIIISIFVPMLDLMQGMDNIVEASQ